MTTRGCFMTLEGLDGAGKSTHIEWIAHTLRAAGVDLICSREPGGTALGERLREILLRDAMDLRAETLLMFAARSEHWYQHIQPALARGQWVLCDRYTDASYAYQGGGRGLGAPAIEVLENWALQGVKPDHTILFDIPLEVARARLERGREHADRFEREGAAFFERTRAAYLARVAEDPTRFHVVDARQAIAEVRSDLACFLHEVMRSHGIAPVAP
ncbi:MAG TPA: dTMP kinase [Castellaniella sp.]|uniref:dTMP kinase n=1 Tax=Castellaniella sp. TaxID=1955812 RepID=UPI002EF0327A